MNYEYFVIPETEVDRERLWSLISQSVGSSKSLVKMEHGEYSLKHKRSNSDWEFDVRVFGPQPIILEISSWNDEIRNEVTSIFNNIRSQVSYFLTDEDDEIIDLFND